MLFDFLRPRGRTSARRPPTPGPLIRLLRLALPGRRGRRPTEIIQSGRIAFPPRRPGSPVGGFGGATSRLYRHGDNPEPKQTEEFALRIESDPQFALGLSALSSIIQGAQASVHSPSDDPRAQALAHNLTQRWHDSVTHALKAFGRGRAAFELWYEWDSVRKLHLLGGLEYLEFADSSLRLDEAGHIAGVDLKVGDKRHRLPANNCWWFALDATPSCPHGKSRYLGAPFRIWKARRALERNYDAWLDKFALGHGVLKAPSQYPPLWKNSQSGYADSNLDGTPADPLEDGERLLAELRSGGVAVLPSETDEHGAPLWSYEPPSIRQDAGPLERRQALLDAYALRSLGIPERAVTQDASTGSYAMAEVHWRVLLSTCEGVLSQMASSFQRQVVQRVEAVNAPPNRRWNLKLVWQKLDPTLSALAMDLVKSILQSPKPSPLVLHGVVDLAKLLEIVRLPTGDDLPARLAAAMQESTGASAPPAPDGHQAARGSFQLATAGVHAPKGGVEIGGVFYYGGEFIPQSDISNASAADRRTLEDKLKGSTPAEERADRYGSSDSPLVDYSTPSFDPLTALKKALRRPEDDVLRVSAKVPEDDKPPATSKNPSVPATAPAPAEAAVQPESTFGDLQPRNFGRVKQSDLKEMEREGLAKLTGYNKYAPPKEQITLNGRNVDDGVFVVEVPNGKGGTQKLFYERAGGGLNPEYKLVLSVPGTFKTEVALRSLMERNGSQDEVNLRNLEAFFHMIPGAMLTDRMVNGAASGVSNLDAAMDGLGLGAMGLKGFAAALRGVKAANAAKAAKAGGAAKAAAGAETATAAKGATPEVKKGVDAASRLDQAALGTELGASGIGASSQAVEAARAALEGKGDLAAGKAAMALLFLGFGAKAYADAKAAQAAERAAAAAKRKEMNPFASTEQHPTAGKSSPPVDMMEGPSARTRWKPEDYPRYKEQIENTLKSNGVTAEVQFVDPEKHGLLTRGPNGKIETIKARFKVEKDGTCKILLPEGHADSYLALHEQSHALHYGQILKREGGDAGKAFKAWKDLTTSQKELYVFDNMVTLFKQGKHGLVEKDVQKAFDYVARKIEATALGAERARYLKLADDIRKGNVTDFERILNFKLSFQHRTTQKGILQT